MTTQPQPEALRQRLLDHAACHESDHWLMAEDEQRQWASDLREAEALMGRLHAECEALRADAGRYRLLCEVHGPSTELCFDGRSYRGKAEFDAAIDAARAAKEQSNG